MHRSPETVLDGFVFHRMTVAPRGDDLAAVTDRPDEAGGRAPAQLFAALTAAHAGLRGRDDGAFAVAWERERDGRGLRILVGGRPDSPIARPIPGSPRDVPLLYPPGSLGIPAPTPEIAERWAGLASWIRCAGGPDPLWTPQAGGEAPGRGGFDDYVTHLPGEFVWLVVAEPLAAEAVERELLVLETTMPRLRQRENSEPDRVELVRAEARYRELARAKAVGLWSVHVLVGGPDDVSTRTAAALLCGASDLDALPYVLAPCDEAGAFADVWYDHGKGAELSSPFSATAELVAALARPPRRELPGIRVIEPPLFDVTPENEGDVPLGTVLDDADQPVGEYLVPLDTLNRHTFVAGATGSGKSQTVRHLLEGLGKAGVPWLVIEPAKAEYAAMAGRLGEDGAVTVIRPGDPETYPAGLNPLEPAEGFPLQTHMDYVRALFLAAFEADEPFPQVLAQALTRCYTDQGWDPVTGGVRGRAGSARYPSLGDLQTVAKEVVKGIGYGKEVADNVRGFVDVRIGSLRLGTPGRFFEGGHPLDVAKLLRGNVVLEIEDIGSDADKAFFIGAVLIRIFEHLRVNHRARARGLRHVLVLEEAHRLLKRVEPGSPAAHAVELFTSLLAEIRAYGEGIIVAEQIPGKIVPDVVKNTACKILHRLPAEDDRQSVGATMNLSEAQSRHVVTLPPGRAAVFTDGMDRPLRLLMPLNEERESADLVSRSPAVGRRSAACGSLCAVTPCTLGQLSDAVHSADEDERFVLWIELLTVAHLTGRPAPEPDPGWVSSLRSRFSARALECALAHRVQSAVDSRYAGIAKRYPADDLIRHLTESATRTLNTLPHGCKVPDVRWQAGRYRWYDVYQALKRTDLPTPHPDTPAWRARGLDLEGTTTAEQLTALRAHPDHWRGGDETVLGTLRPTLVETAIARLSNNKDPVERFKAATGFLNLNWRAAAVLRLDQKDLR
ncbi:DNA helicase HerA, contains HAS-barrel and ATPase domains [Lentzea xinjiangensis]|uniref:DNA helicase HerA, contains HAS-barrel and ATPase domains n=1 Tax=Lentzea xinjiangensis TaxID=402600 RepID=A0A1H9QN23_9PSEU|nr:ATP-binding protein [Lentzea xinjiangensis]SER61249.1 DNA helicase HerA, contains HAS-barrel and ATPase domains [Lentzea xinjiangensis]